MSDTVNPRLEMVQKTFKDLVWDNIVDAAIAAVMADQPLLRLPVINDIFTAVTHVAADQLFSQIKLGCDIAAIPILNAAHRREFDAASARLFAIAKAEGVDSETYRKAREDAKVALARFVRFNA